jgi:hypothetical protein
MAADIAGTARNQNAHARPFRTFNQFVGLAYSQPVAIALQGWPKLRRDQAEM